MMKAALKEALRNVGEAVPQSVEETVGKLEALIGSLRAIANA